MGGILSKLTDKEMWHAVQTVSDDLQLAPEEDIRAALRLLPSDFWPQVLPIPKQRTEHVLISSIAAGKYSKEKKAVTAGSLGTWATGIIPHFTMKSQLLSAIARKLQSGSPEQEDYVFQYFFHLVDKLADEPTWSLENAIQEGLEKGSSRFKAAMDASFLWNNQKWSDSVKKAVAEFSADGFEDFQFPEDDDLPF